MNLRAVSSIYYFEMMRFFRTITQSLISPVLSTSLYFIVFGTAIGSRIQEVEGISYGAFIVPGLIMLSVLQQSIVLGYVGAAASKSLFIGLIILGTAFFFVDLHIQHPLAMIAFLALTCISFSLFGFIIGLWSKNFEQLQLVPLLVVTPLVFLGGSFYSIDMLPEGWQTVALFNPVVYLISGFRWSFFGMADVAVGVSLAMIALFLLICLGVIWWTYRTGFKIRS